MITCRSCGHFITKFFSLGKMPLVNAFLRKGDIPNEKKYDLSIGFCPNCYLVQLTKTVDPKDLFRHYLYFSSATKTIVEHSARTALHLKNKLNLTPKSLVLEIGSNDGVQLQCFKDLGIQILGIDPARNVARVANAQGIKTIPEFFDLALAKKLTDQHIEPNLIYGANVLAHVPEIIDFLKGVKLILGKKGSAIFEFPYLKGLMENKFDTIYHEHVFYYSLIALRNLFSKVDMEIYDVEKISMQGGSLRIFASHAKSFPVSPAVTKLINQELKDGFNRLSAYKAISNSIKKLKRDLIVLLNKLKKEGKHIAAYGAPAKGMILLNYFGISKYLDFIVDKAPAKQRLYTPGTHMLIHPPSKIEEQKPDCLLILCWNIKGEVMAQNSKYRELGGKFIIPIPQIKII